MATKKQIRMYAEANGISREAARQHFINEAKKKNGNECRLLILKRDSRNGNTEFQCGVLNIPNTSKISRNDAIGSLGIEWGHDGKILCMVSEYLSYSPTLNMARAGVYDKNSVIQSPAGIGTIDLDDLGCYIEFYVDHSGVHTKGPLWMTTQEVKIKADEIAKTYASTHDIKYSNAA